MDSLDIFPSRNERVAWRMLGDEAVVLDLRSERRFHELNSVGALIWKLCDGSKSCEQISREIVDQYEIDPETALLDLRDFVLQLSQEGLIHWGKS